MKKIILLALLALSIGIKAQVTVPNLPLVAYPANPIVKDSDLCINNKHDSVGSSATVGRQTCVIYMKDLKTYCNSNTFFADTNLENIQYTQPTTGNTIVSNGRQRLIVDPSGTLAALTITFPSAPATGQIFSISISQIITTLTLGAGGNAIKGTIVTSATNSAGSWIYYQPNQTWFKR